MRLSIARGGREVASEGEAFLHDLFSSEALRAALPALAEIGEGFRLRYRPLRCSATSLSIFDPLIEAGALREGSDGRVFIPGRVEESWDGLAITNLAREALCLPPDGDPFEEDPSGDASAMMLPNRFTYAVKDTERTELLWNLARWAVAGGGMCQWDDDWTPYADAVRDVARDILSVVRAETDDASAPPRVMCTAWKVEGVVDRKKKLFPHENAHNVCFVVADTLKRVVHVIWSPFIPWVP